MRWKNLGVEGHPEGLAIVSFPGHDLRKEVAAGAVVDLPDDLSVEVVQRACPSLIPATETAVVTAQPAPVRGRAPRKE